MGREPFSASLEWVFPKQEKNLQRGHSVSGSPVPKAEKMFSPSRKKHLVMSAARYCKNWWMGSGKQRTHPVCTLTHPLIASCMSSFCLIPVAITIGTQLCCMICFPYRHWNNLDFLHISLQHFSAHTREHWLGITAVKQWLSGLLLFLVFHSCHHAHCCEGEGGYHFALCWDILGWILSHETAGWVAGTFAGASYKLLTCLAAALCQLALSLARVWRLWLCLSLSSSGS